MDFTDIALECHKNNISLTHFINSNVGAPLTLEQMLTLNIITKKTYNKLKKSPKQS